MAAHKAVAHTVTYSDCVSPFHGPFVQPNWNMFVLRLTSKFINYLSCKSFAKTNLQTKWNVIWKELQNQNINSVKWQFGVSIVKKQWAIWPKMKCDLRVLKAKFVGYGHMPSANQSPTNSSIQDTLPMPSQYPKSVIDYAHHQLTKSPLFP